MKKALVAFMACVCMLALVPASVYAENERSPLTEVEALLFTLERAQDRSLEYIWIRPGPLNGRGSAGILDTFSTLCSWAHDGEVEYDRAVSECMDRQETFRIRTWVTYCDCEDAWFRVVLTRDELRKVVTYTTREREESPEASSSYANLTDLLEQVLAGQIRIESQFDTLTEIREVNVPGLQELTSAQEDMLVNVQRNTDVIGRVEEKVDLLASQLEDVTLGDQLTSESGAADATTDHYQSSLRAAWEWVNANFVQLLVIILIPALLALFLFRREKKRKQAPAAVVRKKQEHTATGETMVVLQPDRSPYTSAAVTDEHGATQTLILSKVGESQDDEHRGEPIYKTPYANRVREANLVEHIKKQWEKTHV